MKRAIVFLMTGLVLLGGTACRAVGRHTFANPVVGLKDVQVTGIGLEGGSLDVVLDVYNPNSYRLDATKLTYRLFVDSAALAFGEVDKLVTLEERKSSEVRLPVSFTLREVLGAAMALTRTGSVDYRVTGELTVATPFGNFTRPYEGRGRYDTLRR